MKEPTQKNISKEWHLEEKENNIKEKDHRNKDNTREAKGEEEYTRMLEWKGVRDCLVRSLKASKRG